MPIDSIFLSYKNSMIKDKQRPKSYADLGVKNNDEFKMLMKIFVEDFNGVTHEYFVAPDDAVEGVRKDASGDSGIPLKHVHLQFNEQDMDTASTLDSSNVKHLDTLKMVFTVNVVDLENFKFQVNVKPDTTLKDVKQQIRDKTGMALDDIHIQFNKRDLEEMKKSLDDEGVVHKDTLRLVYLIYVVDQDGNRHEFKVDPNDTIDDLKKKIGDKIDIPVDEIGLEDWLGNSVDTGTVKSNNIKHKDTLYMGFECPAQEAFELCPTFSKNKCNNNAKAKKLCSWCSGDGQCRAGKE